MDATVSSGIIEERDTTTARHHRARAIAIIDWSFVALPAVVLIASVLAVQMYDRSWWVDVIFDDGYYYLGVARGLAEQHRSWFMPPFETNGYQPLWQAVLWASATVFGTSDASLVVQALALSVGFLALFCAAAKRFYGALSPAVLAAFHFSLVSLYGMETAMMPVLALCFFRARDWRARGILASLIFLTRLDALALVVAADLVDAGTDRRLAVKHYLILVPVIAAYAAFNLVLFGIPVPVSGLMKAVGNVRGENLGVVLTFVTSLKYPLVAAGILALAACLTRTRPRIRHGREMAALLIALGASALYYGVNSGWGVWGWYVWAAMLLDFYLLLNLLDVLALAFGRRTSAVDLRFLLPLAACVILVVRPAQLAVNRVALAMGPTYGFTDRDTSGVQNMALLKDIEARALPKDTYFAMGDRAGSFGFFLGRGYRFFHTEGLVGPVEYYRAARIDQAKPFVEGLPIDYLVTDRTAYLTDGEVIGVVEPVQGISAHAGPYLTCFPRAAIVSDQSYLGGRRYVFEVRRRVACPAPLETQFLDLRAQVNGVRGFSISW